MLFYYDKYHSENGHVASSLTHALAKLQYANQVIRSSVTIMNNSWKNLSSKVKCINAHVFNCFKLKIIQFNLNLVAYLNLSA